MAFQQERAVKLVGGERVPLSPSDVASETGLKKQNIRPAILELREWGLADINGSTKGAVEMFAWARPRLVEKPAGDGNGNGARYHFEAPREVLTLLKRFKINLPENFVPARGYFERVLEKAAVWAVAEAELKVALRCAGESDGNGATAGSGNGAEERLVPARGADGNAAADRSNKEERNKGQEREPSSSSSDVQVEAETTTTTPPNSPGTGTATATATAMAPTLVEEQRQVAAAMGTSDLDAATQLLMACRRAAPDCTADNICAFIERKRPQARDNPIGFFIRAVPKCFTGDWRTALSNPPPEIVDAKRKREMESTQRGVDMLRYLRRNEDP